MLHQEKEVKSKNQFTDRAVDFIFSNDVRKYLIILLIIGIVLRIIFSLQIGFGADEMGYASHAIGFVDAHKLQIHDQDGVWFYLTDSIMKILGYNVFGLRFLSALTGALSIILIYLIAKEIFNKKIAILSAVVMTFSSYSIILTTGVMDVPMTFFAFLGIYFLILFLKLNKHRYFILSWVSIGIAIMIKQIALLFIPAFIIYTLYYNKKFNKKFKFQQIFYAAIIIILLVTPVLTYNYLLYKDKQLVDLQFSRFFDIPKAEQHYASISHTLNPFSLETLFISHFGEAPGILLGLNFAYIFESIIAVLFALFGFFLFAKSKNRFKWLIILSLAFPFLFLAGTSLLPNHFIFLSMFISLFAGKGIYEASLKFKDKNKRKQFIYIVFILLIIFSFIQIYQSTNSLTGKHEIAKLIDFKENSISENSLVVVDSRIYRGRIVFMFWDRHYLESNFFPDLLNQGEELPGQLVPMDVYFVEAVTDDSGWGSVSSQPGLNQTSEEIVGLFSEQANVIGTIDDLNGDPHYRIYHGKFNLKESTLQAADSTHEFFFYPVEYKPSSKVFDNYEIYSSTDNLLNKFAHLILKAEVVLVFVFFIYIFYFLYKRK
jgi:putative effector of murein hydrolase LrgA (UPF0299 family)